MVTNLERLQESWKELIFRGELEKAEKLYWKELFLLVKEKFVSDVRKRIDSGEIPKYDLLLLPIGMGSPFYSIMLISALKPQKVYFICTKEGEKYTLGKIISYAKLSPDMYIKDVVEYAGMDAAEIYEKIKRVIEMFKGKRMAVDLTYGKRVMVAGAAIVCDFFGCDMIYIDEDWVEEIKRGVPGTERLVKVKNPLNLFGELEQYHATELFNRYRYTVAHELFEKVKSKVPDPREFEIKSLISQGYDAWDSLNFSTAFHILNSACNKIGQYNLKLGGKEQLSLNLKALKILEVAQSGRTLLDLLKDKKFVIHLLVDIFCNASRRAEQNQFEDALSRLYRGIEIVSQHRLALSGIDTASPDYSKFELLSERYAETTKELYGKEKTVPSTIPLMDGHIILFALEDALWKGKGVKDLKELLESIKLRDYSIIAHGIQLVNRNTFTRFKSVTNGMLLKLCEMYDEDFEKLIIEHTHIKLNR